MEKREGWLSRIFNSLKPVNVMKGTPQSGKGGTVLRSRSESQTQNLEPQVESRAQEVSLYEALQWEKNEVLLDEYIVEGILGQGGMGTVYLVARRTSDGVRFAVKTLLSSALEDRKQTRLFMRELRTWISLPEHPHITACRFFRTIEDRLAIFAEYVEGGTLQGWIKHKKLLSLEMILDVAIQCAWGLQAAHVQGVVHQDMKPANVLMTKDGLAKITDFGLARAVYEGGIEKLTEDRPKSILVSVDGMTKEYCSPEQANWQKLTHRTDIWSWGLSVLEMFTGSVTWGHGTWAKDALERFIKDGPRPPYPAMSADVAAALERCFQEDPTQRWYSLGEVEEVLREIYRQETGQIYPREKPALLPSHDFERMILDRRTAKGARWDDPKKWLAKALSLSGRDPSELNGILKEQKGSRKEQAILDLELYERAMNVYSDLAKQGMRNMEIVLAHLLTNKAFVHEYVADVPGAIALHDKAIKLLDQLVNKEGRSDLADGLAGVYMCRGSATSSLGNKQSAMEFYDKAIQIGEQLVNKEGRFELAGQLARAYMNKGVALRDVGDKCSAVLLYDETIQLLERFMKKDGRSESSDELAKVYMNKGAALSDLGDNSSAVVLYDKAIQLLERLVKNENRSELADELAMAYMNKGATVFILGDNSLSLEFYDKAIEIREQLVNIEGRSELANQLAVAYMNKAVAVETLRDYHSAMELYDKVIQIRERLVKKEGRSELSNELAIAYMNKASTVSAVGDNRSAMELYDKAIQILDRLVNEEGQLELANDLATVYMNKANFLKNDRSAVDLYDKAIPLLKRLVNKEGRSELLGDLAWVKSLKSASLYNLGDMQEAKNEIQAALPILRAEAKRTGRTDLKNVLNLAESVSNKFRK